MTDIVYWTISVLLILLGVAGTVLPALPGVIFVLAGIVLGAWIDDFTRVSTWTVGGLLGAQKVGASKQALFGAALGTVVGLFMGLVGVLFMPLIGAGLGEYLAQRQSHRAIKVGIATWLGLMLGLIAKVVIVFMMIGIFIVALLIP